MSCFVDSSAFIAITDPNDLNHRAAVGFWERLTLARSPLITSNYVVVETMAIMHARRGIPVVQRFSKDIAPVLTVVWVSREMHDSAVKAMLSGGRRGPGIVDCVSFEVMRQQGIAEALAFDRHFDDQGYRPPSIP